MAAWIWRQQHEPPKHRARHTVGLLTKHTPNSPSRRRRDAPMQRPSLLQGAMPAAKPGAKPGATYEVEVYNLVSGECPAPRPSHGAMSTLLLYYNWFSCWARGLHREDADTPEDHPRLIGGTPTPKRGWNRAQQCLLTALNHQPYENDEVPKLYSLKPKHSALFAVPLSPMHRLSISLPQDDELRAGIACCMDSTIAR